jgi:hypothetical protein
MSELASDLRAWARSMELIAPELIEPVALAASELHAMVGPLRPRGARRGGEPNGFKGLARRGSYDRLLLSEWAMLDEAPDEFLRRAIASEHAFYELDHQQPARSMEVRLVLDAGPTQLGIPRLGQLAALLLLVRRAMLARATIRWSVAQAPAMVWDTLDRRAIAHLLEARSIAPFELPDLSEEPVPDELWVIGPPPSSSWANARVLTLCERLTPDGEVLEASSLDLHGALRTRALSLPPPVVRRRLITNPFVSERATTRPSPQPSQPSPSTGGIAWTTWPMQLGAPTGVRFVRNTLKLELRHARGVELVNLSKLPAAPVSRGYPIDPVRLIATGYHGGHPVLIERAAAGEVLSVSGFRVPAADVDVAEDRVRAQKPKPTVGHGEFFALDGQGWIVDASGKVFKIPRTGPLERSPSVLSLVDALVGRGHVRLLVRLFERLRLIVPLPGQGLRLLLGSGSTSSLDLGPGEEALLSLPDRTSGFAVVRSGRAWTATALPKLGLPTSDPSLRVDLSSETDPGTTILGLRADAQGSVRAVVWELNTAHVQVRGGHTLVLPRVPIAPKLSLDGRYLAFHTAPDDANLPGGTFELWDLDRRAPCLLRKQAPEWKQ